MEPDTWWLKPCVLTLESNYSTQPPENNLFILGHSCMTDRYLEVLWWLREFFIYLFIFFFAREVADCNKKDTTPAELRFYLCYCSCLVY
jgi:hypothetical protein